MNLKNIFFVNYNLLLIIIISFSILLRFYNLNHESFWIDEIISFYVANPNISFYETIQRHNLLEQVPILFNISLKIYFKIFGYDYSHARYLVSFFSICSLAVCYLIIKKITKNKSIRLFFIFLVGLNIYLIKYSFELRVYSLFVLLISFSLYYFICITNGQQNKKNLFLFILFSILSFLSHPFSLIVIFSCLLYYSFKSFKQKKFNQNINISFLIIFLIACIYYALYFYHLNEITSWIKIIDFKFFTNLYFSKFFGSRIIGLFFLISLIILIYRNFNFILNSNLLIFLLIIINSFALPILFSFLIKPILIDRYIIYVIVAILVLISILTFKIKNNKLRSSILFLFVFLTIGNFFTEDNFKQFYKLTPKYKPEFNEAILLIENSNISNLFVKKFMPPSKDKIKFYSILDDGVNEYLQHIININVHKVRLHNNNNMSSIGFNEFWILCYVDLDYDKCNLPSHIQNYNILDEMHLSKINLKLVLIK